MQRVDAAGNPIHEERLVGRKCLMVVEPLECMIGQVDGQMILRVVTRWLDVVVVFGQERDRTLGEGPRARARVVAPR